MDLKEAFDLPPREQYVFRRHTLPPNGSSSLTESGVILENEFTLVDPSGTPYTRLTVCLCPSQRSLLTYSRSVQGFNV